MAEPNPDHLTAPLVVHAGGSDADLAQLASDMASSLCPLLQAVTDRITGNPELQGMAFGTVYLAECIHKLIDEVAARTSRAERLRNVGSVEREVAGHG